MSNRDVLAAASRALREETAHSPRRIALPRRRDALVATLRSRRVTAQRITMSMVATLTFLVASAAWATATGRLPLAKFVEACLGRHEVAAPPVSHNDRATPTRAARVAPLVTTSAEPAPVTPVVALDPIVAAPAAMPRGVPAVHTPHIDPHDELYRAAHVAQFVQHDPASAVAAWDRYLAVAPSGRFAVEASYNRAISLVRLGRYDDAHRALAPFARGDHGAYRQREAREILDRLPSAP